MNLEQAKRVTDRIVTPAFANEVSSAGMRAYKESLQIREDYSEPKLASFTTGNLISSRFLDKLHSGLSTRFPEVQSQLLSDRSPHPWLILAADGLKIAIGKKPSGPRGSRSLIPSKNKRNAGLAAGSAIVSQQALLPDFDTDFHLADSIGTDDNEYCFAMIVHEPNQEAGRGLGGLKYYLVDKLYVPVLPGIDLLELAKQAVPTVPKINLRSKIVPIHLSVQATEE